MNTASTARLLASGTVSMGDDNAARWAWCAINGALPERNDRGWMLFFNDRIFIGDTPEQACDAARAA